MDIQTDFEREIADRVEKIESALMALTQKVERLGDARTAGQPARPDEPAAQPTGARAAIRPPRIMTEPAVERGPDWWLARAGAGLTLVAVILLYQYAVGHGWITPTVRVMMGTAIGAALMYYGRKMPSAQVVDSPSVAIRELMMGAGLAAWYITAFVASARYHLIPLSVSLYLFLALSIVGAALSLSERRSTLGLIAVTAGFLGSLVLAEAVQSVPAYGLYIAVLGALSIVLYLMRGWQSVLWISFFAASMSLASPQFYAAGIVPTTMGLLLAMAYVRAPALRRGLLATGSERYTDPIRSQFATHWLNETGRFLKLFSPAAGQLDSVSVWFVTLAAPLAGLWILSRAWPLASDAVWGAVTVAIAIAAFRMCGTSKDDSTEITHLEGAASLVWGTFGTIGIARALVAPSLVDHGTITLGFVAIAALAPLILLQSQRFVAARAVGRAMAGLVVIAVLLTEAAFVNAPGAHPDRIGVALSAAEILAIGAGAITWRDMRRREIGGIARDALILASYGALLLVDARVLGEIWKPLVTASFAIAGTAMLFMSRKDDNRMLRAVGGGTLALVMFRLFVVDMSGVDTIWRVILFLGIGALFLFTSRQLQVGKPAKSESS